MIQLLIQRRILMQKAASDAGDAADTSDEAGEEEY